MQQNDYDVTIVGGGAAGLAAAIGSAQAGLQVRLLGAPTLLQEDGRSAALFMTSLDFLRSLGVAAALQQKGQMLREIVLVDRTSGFLRAPTTRFRACELDREAFAWNILNVDIIATLLEEAKKHTNLTLDTAFFSTFQPVKTPQQNSGNDTLEIVTQGGARFSTRLLIGADGQNSAIRQAAGIGHKIHPYNQVALTCRLAHQRDHEDASLEFHTSEGPCTLVPLPCGADGRFSSALVWLMTPENARRILSLSPQKQAIEIETITYSALGEVEVFGGMANVPMRQLQAERLIAPRVALVGEAAHAFPPIGAQGLNMGLRDVRVLLEYVLPAFEKGRHLQNDGATHLQNALEAYEKKRQRDMMWRMKGVDFMNVNLLSSSLLANVTRYAGLSLLKNISPLRQLLMRLGGAMPLFTRDAKM